MFFIYSKHIKVHFTFHFSAMMLCDCSRLGEGYYSAPLLGQHLVTYVIQPWKHLPNYRLRNFVHILYLQSNNNIIWNVCTPSPTQQKSWRPCWCSRQKSLIKIILNGNANMAAVTSCANALFCTSETFNFLAMWNTRYLCIV